MSHFSIQSPVTFHVLLVLAERISYKMRPNSPQNSDKQQPFPDIRSPTPPRLSRCARGGRVGTAWIIRFRWRHGRVVLQNFVQDIHHAIVGSVPTHLSKSVLKQGWKQTYKTLGCTTLALLKKMSSPFFVTLMVVFRNDSSTIPSRMRSRYNGCLRTWDLASLLASILPGLCLDQHSPNQPRQLRLIELLLRIPRRFKRLVARPQARHITSRVNRVVCSRVSQRGAQRLERAQFIHRRCAVFGELEDPVCP